ncbi:TPA: pilus assembly protein PilZ [Legionella pneumophila]|nr:pilus assembly protein PilZ [Legionella pneumophila]HAU1320839.1 pilus assembly protein PilZ [Legionella pneumophila]HBC0466506.1 PilZ domain-containing protein [Legionella pneumophila]HBD9373811.1 PilZ domain-containing protein [Legionella pneumophila]HBI2946468.1 PilZ domain-containing protein [Legionella pneumophila]
MTEKPQLINCSFPNEASLYIAYMPFVKGGGLFIRTQHVYPLGQSLELSVKLLDENEPYLVAGKVVWITPKGAQGNKPPGVGIQFTGENSRYLCNKIETYLAGMLKSCQVTDTI